MVGFHELFQIIFYVKWSLLGCPSQVELKCHKLSSSDDKAELKADNYIDLLDFHSVRLNCYNCSCLKTTARLE